MGVCGLNSCGSGRDELCVLVKTVMNICVHKGQGISFRLERLSASQKTLCTMEFVNRNHNSDPVTLMSLAVLLSTSGQL
jgi:hypothetical protein